ncbi:MAG: putative portal protein [Prokaryotic dsDNA virus sp.]|nr:MAG: putative portal protein [Prokaryotic dsDNA virus sp.]|tara:strand:- start:25376 stop:26869 length:1494 start_codon:yes stop_codon:yes gene_type:complete
MPNVAFVRKDLKALLPLYQLIRDCIDGEVKVKAAKAKYLPQPNAEDESEENLARFKAYIERAVFYNVTARTLKGFVGQVFLRDPVVEVPTLLQIVNEDANGGGVSLTQSSKKAVAYVLSHGRAGLFVDYPATEGVASRAQLEAGDIRPTVNLYAPWRVLNWRTTKRGAREILSLVVLSETYIQSDDGFEMKEAEQFRVLRLGKSQDNVQDNIDEGVDVYTVEVWRKEGGNFGISESYQPRDSSGALLKEIPFTFIGSENNDVEIDNPPLYDLASLNIAHYRNSADYEESCFIVGQPTPYFAGLTEEWVKNVMGGTVTLGSRGAVPLPEGGSAGLLQAASNTMPKEAMEHKERQMVALGAKLVEQTTVQRTATEADLEATSENSTLTSSAKNVSAAYQWGLEWCAIFVGVPENGIKFELNTEFDIANMTPQERAQVISEWQSGAISFTEMRENLRKAGVAKLDDKKAKEEIDAELADAPNMNDNSGGNPDQTGDNQNQ